MTLKRDRAAYGKEIVVPVIRQFEKSRALLEQRVKE